MCRCRCRSHGGLQLLGLDGVDTTSACINAAFRLPIRGCSGLEDARLGNSDHPQHPASLPRAEPAEVRACAGARAQNRQGRRGPSSSQCSRCSSWLMQKSFEKHHMCTRSLSTGTFLIPSRSLPRRSAFGGLQHSHPSQHESCRSSPSRSPTP